MQTNTCFSLADTWVLGWWKIKEPCCFLTNAFASCSGSDKHPSSRVQVLPTGMWGMFKTCTIHFMLQAFSMKTYPIGMLPKSLHLIQWYDVTCFGVIFVFDWLSPLAHICSVLFGCWVQSGMCSRVWYCVCAEMGWPPAHKSCDSPSKTEPWQLGCFKLEIDVSDVGLGLLWKWLFLEWMTCSNVSLLCSSFDWNQNTQVPAKSFQSGYL